MHKGLISQDVVDNLLSWEHSGFSVHGDVKVPDRESAARLGRYMIRCPIVLERLSLDEDTGEVLYRTRPSRGNGAPPHVASPPLSISTATTPPEPAPSSCRRPLTRSPFAAAPGSPGRRSSSGSTKSTAAVPFLRRRDERSSRS